MNINSDIWILACNTCIWRSEFRYLKQIHISENNFSYMNSPPTVCEVVIHIVGGLMGGWVVGWVGEPVLNGTGICGSKENRKYTDNSPMSQMILPG